MGCVVRCVTVCTSSPSPLPLSVAPEVINISQDQLAVSPDPVVMFCEATGYPRPNIAWFFNGTLVTINETVTIDTVVSPLENTTLGLGRVTSYLRLSVTRPSDAGVYECVSSNLLGSDTDRTNLTVHCECGHMSTGAQQYLRLRVVSQCRIVTHRHHIREQCHSYRVWIV